MKIVTQRGTGAWKVTRAPPPTAPARNAASASAMSASFTCVSASTKKSISPLEARAPALRAAAIWRIPASTTRAPWSRAIRAVSSVDASFATTTSYGSPTTRAAA
jgi:hypothetical protein